MRYHSISRGDTPATAAPLMGSTFIVGSSPTAREAGRSVPSFYRDIAGGLFPPPLRLGPRRSAWLRSEVAAVNAARVRGASQDEIKQLVHRLVEARTTFGVEVSP